MAKKSKVWFGLSGVAVAFETDDGVYEVPEKVSGAVKFTYEGKGDQDTFHADNGAYYVANGSSGAEGELEMAAFPDSVIARMLGWTIDKNGALVETEDGIAEPFALMFQVEGDVHPRRAAVYKMTASSPKEEWVTNEDGVEVKTTVLPYKAIPVEMGGRKFAKATLEKSDTNAAVFDAFYDSVYVPVFDEDASKPEHGTEPTNPPEGETEDVPGTDGTE